MATAAHTQTHTHQTHARACTGKHGHLCAGMTACANVGSHGQPQTPTAPGGSGNGGGSNTGPQVEGWVPLRAGTFISFPRSAPPPPPSPCYSQVWTGGAGLPHPTPVIPVLGERGGVKAGREVLFGRCVMAEEYTDRRRHQLGKREGPGEGSSLRWALTGPP